MHFHRNPSLPFHSEQLHNTSFSFSFYFTSALCVTHTAYLLGYYCYCEQKDFVIQRPEEDSSCLFVAMSFKVIDKTQTAAIFSRMLIMSKCL